MLLGKIKVFIFCQSLEFETVEIISRDNIIPSADLKNKYLDFAKQHGWKESSNSVFRGPKVPYQCRQCG
jgi:hypothetical protein